MSNMSERLSILCGMVSSLAICPSKKHGTVSAEYLPKPRIFFLRLLDIPSGITMQAIESVKYPLRRKESSTIIYVLALWLFWYEKALFLMNFSTSGFRITEKKDKAFLALSSPRFPHILRLIDYTSFIICLPHLLCYLWSYGRHLFEFCLVFW